jgi:hypothetical protein
MKRQSGWTSLPSLRRLLPVGRLDPRELPLECARDNLVLSHSGDPSALACHRAHGECA